MWTLRLPPAKALMDLVDISRWSFLPRKTLQSETMEAMYQRQSSSLAGSALGPGPQRPMAAQVCLESPSRGVLCAHLLL